MNYHTHFCCLSNDRTLFLHYNSEEEVPCNGPKKVKDPKFHRNQSCYGTKGPVCVSLSGPKVQFFAIPRRLLLMMICHSVCARALIPIINCYFLTIVCCGGLSGSHLCSYVPSRTHHWVVVMTDCLCYTLNSTTFSRGLLWENSLPVCSVCCHFDHQCQ